MVYIGLMQMSSGCYRSAMDNGWSKGFDVVALPITNKSDSTKDGDESDPLDVALDEFNYRTILMLSCHWSLPDISLDRELMQKEIDNCRYLRNNCCMLLRLTKEVNTVQASMFPELKGMLIIEVPAIHRILVSQLHEKNKFQSKRARTVSSYPHDDTWRWWYTFSKNLNFNAHLRVCIEVYPEIEPSVHVINRWLSEPLEAVVFPRDFFIVHHSDENNTKTVSVKIRFSELQTLIQIYERGVNVLVRASPNDDDLEHIVKYLKELGKKYMMKPLRRIGMLASRLHLPNIEVLSSWTQQLFKDYEDDLYKYKCYTETVSHALYDINRSVQKPNVLERKYNVLVVAPPHARMLSAVIEGVRNSNVSVCIYHVTIGSPKVHDITKLSPKITVIECNIAVENLGQQLPLIDLMVNEQFGIMEEGRQMSEHTSARLLGCLNPYTGCCIPSSLSVFIRPVMSTRLYNSYRKLENELAKCNQHSTHCMPFPSRNVFNFALPQFAYKVLYKYCKVEGVCCRSLGCSNNTLRVFKAGGIDCVMHALRADYVINLYKNVVIASRQDKGFDPEKVSLSTMPIFFMFKDPIFLKRDDKIEIKFVRRNLGNKSWYEWSMSGHSIQNSGGCVCTAQHENKLF